MSAKSPSRAIMRVGTEEATPDVRVLRAGPLSAEFEGGKLRYIRIGGREAIRGIAFVVRGPGWETFAPQLSQLRIRETSERFEISYAGRVSQANGTLSFGAEIEGTADGKLRFDVVGRAETEFETGRTGFVILHPVQGVAGAPCTITHVDGSVDHTRFPDTVMALQPFFDIRAMTHEVAPGLSVTCRMEGEDPWETEDQRNWTDASYKTYYRPLAKPFPYKIAQGSEIRQSITLSFEGPLPAAGAAADEPVQVTVGGDAGAMPKIGLGVPAHQAVASLDAVERIKKIGPKLLVCEFDPRRHGEKELSAYAHLSEALGAPVTLEVVVPCERDVAEELKDAAARVAAVGLKPDAVLVEQLRLMYFTLQKIEELGIPSFEETYSAARNAFPGVTLGGGVFSSFTELNRNYPAPELYDFITHTTCGVVHEPDDRSVMETLQSLPSIIRSVRAIAPGKTYRVGPSAIGMRYNPYGPSTHDNQANIRMSFNQQDPRHRALAGSAFTLGYLARMAYGGVDAVTLGAPVGEFGMLYRKMDHPQPWFDDVPEATVFPLCHVVAALAHASGEPLIGAESSAADRVLALAHKRGAGTLLWLANLTREEQKVSVAGLPSGEATIGRLDESNFVDATTDPDGFAAARGEAGDPADLRLAPYGVARIAIDT